MRLRPSQALKILTFSMLTHVLGDGGTLGYCKHDSQSSVSKSNNLTWEDSSTSALESVAGLALKMCQFFALIESMRNNLTIQKIKRYENPKLQNALYLLVSSESSDQAQISRNSTNAVSFRGPTYDETYKIDKPSNYIKTNFSGFEASKL